MNCNEARQHWNLYHDSEGDAGLHFRIGEHLAGCPDCAAWFERQSRLESLLASQLGPQPPTPELWDRVLTGSGLRKPALARRWLWLSGVAACAAALLVLLGGWLLGGRAPAADLARLSAERHERLAKGEEVQFRSQSDREVEGYLRQQVSFPVRCPPRKDAGFAVQGAGVCTLGEQSAAYLAGNVDQAPVSIFVLPRDSLTAFPRQRDALRREDRHRCREGELAMVMAVIDRNVVLVIGQADAGRLDRVLRAYGTYPDHH